MMFKYVFILSILFYGYSSSLTLYTDVENLIGNDIQECFKCVRRNTPPFRCWDRDSCSRYSITKEYWKKAGAPVINRNEEEDQAYRTCMINENCILNTFKLYTESFGEIDCNYDGDFNCKDRAAIHFFRDNCYNSNLGITQDGLNRCAQRVVVREAQENLFQTSFKV